jgi:hypothetical protein
MTPLSDPARGSPLSAGANLPKSGRDALGKARAQVGSLPVTRGALLSLLLAANGLAGCLVPQSVDSQQNRVKYPPRVVVESLDPKLVGTIRLTHGQLDSQALCSCRVVLEVPQVEEVDTTLNLEARWFVDYDPDKVSTQRPVQTQFLAGSFDSSTSVRQGPKLEIDLTALGLGDGSHVADVVIAEQGAFDDAATTLAHRAVLAGYASAAHRFVIDAVTDDLKVCRSDAPFKRSCGAGP